MFGRNGFGWRGEWAKADQALPHELTRHLLAVGEQLSRADSFEDLCRHAIVLGHRELGFDRLGLWFLNKDHRLQLGTFGIDEHGGLRDERRCRMPLERVVLKIRPGTVLIDRDKPLKNLNGRFVGFVSYLCATIWDGSELIGYLSADNLLRHRPVTQSDAELLAAYAHILSTL